MGDTNRYDRDFFDQIQPGSRASAREIVPTLLALAQPKSVVDVGCGTGSWLAVFRDHGIEDIWGIDGDYIDLSTLAIPKEKFMAADLTKPLELAKRFDLALSLEVAEHLAPEAAENYVNSLVSLSDIVVFSAAIPHQTGEGHVNEQWPEFWKALFEARGYHLLDCLRHRFWNNSNVERWYRQNLMLYVKEEKLRSDPILSKESENNKNKILSIVHPATFLSPSVRTLLKSLPGAIAGSLRRRFS